MLKTLNKGGISPAKGWDVLSTLSLCSDLFQDIEDTIRRTMRAEIMAFHQVDCPNDLCTCLDIADLVGGDLSVFE